MRTADRRQRGFTMIELMMVVTIGGIIAGIIVQEGMAWSKRSTGESAISHQGQVATALGNFVANNYDVLVNIADIQKVRDNVTANREPAWRRLIPRITLAGDAIQQWDGYAFTGNVNDVTTPPAPVLVDCPNRDCVTITVKNLQEWGYLPAEFSDTNPLGFTYKLRIKRIPMAAQPGVPAFSALDAVVAANTPGRLTDNNPYGDPDIIIGMQNAPGVQGLGMSRVTEQNDVTYFASKSLTGPAVGAIGVFGFDADQSGNLGWFFDPVQWGFDNMVKALPVIKTALWSGNKDGVYMRIDHPFVRDDLNMMGNSILNGKKVKIGDPCDADPAKAESLVGAKATVDPLFVDTTNPLSPSNPNKRLGAGYSAICGYDQLSKSFIWKTSSPTGTVEDTQAGLYEGRESIAKLACWGTTAGENAQGVWNAGGANFVKFVIKNGDVWGYAAIVSGNTVTGWLNVTRTTGVPNSGPGTGPGGGYDLNYDWSSFNAGFGTFPVLFYDPAAGFVCRQPYNPQTLTGDRNLAATTSWEMGSQIVSFNAQFTYYVPAVQGGSGQGAETLAGIPMQYNVPTYSISCDGLGSCSLIQGTQVYNATTSARTNADGTTGSWTAISAPGSTTIWPLIKKTRCNLGAPGSPPPMICPT